MVHKTLQFINKQNSGRPQLLASSLEKVCGGGGWAQRAHDDADADADDKHLV